jgi:hypothetical protein
MAANAQVPNPRTGSTQTGGTQTGNIAPVTVVPNAATADYTIPVKLVDGLHALPDPHSPIMNVGETLRYVCSDGASFRVVYQSRSDPTVTFEIADSNVRRLETGGLFGCKCWITRFDGVEVGWDEKTSPESGGEPEIKPHP